jgi:hypothetical protein
MVQLVDEHPGSNFVLLVFGEINQRCKILNDVTACIANRTDEDRGPELAGKYSKRLAIGSGGQPLDFIERDCATGTASAASRRPCRDGNYLLFRRWNQSPTALLFS